MSRVQFFCRGGRVNRLPRRTLARSTPSSSISRSAADTSMAAAAEPSAASGERNGARSLEGGGGRAVGGAGEAERAPLQPLLPEGVAVAVPVQDLQPAARAAAE